MSVPLRVVIAGGGVGGLEALLALHALAGDRVALTLVAADPDFVYRPLAVAAPFALGRPRRTPLAAAARATGAELVEGAVDRVDPALRTIALADGTELTYDALVIALGAASEPALPGAITWDDQTDVGTLGGLLRDLEEGYGRRLAIVIPPGPGWPLPGYELALLIARDAEGMGADASITLVTPEQAPVAAFGPDASRDVAEALREAGVAVESGAYAELRQTPRPTLTLRPSGRALEVDRVIALPRLRGRAPAGVPANADGFIAVDRFCAIASLERVWAVGDVADFPIKFGGIAADQADTAAAAIAALAGADVEPAPFRPVLRGRLLVGPHRDRFLRYDAAGGAGAGTASSAPLWWPPGKIAGRWLAPWLASQDDQAAVPDVPVSDELIELDDTPDLG